VLPNESSFSWLDERFSEMSTVIICNKNLYNPSHLRHEVINANHAVLRIVPMHSGPDMIVTRAGRSMAILDTSYLPSNEETFQNLLKRCDRAVWAANLKLAMACLCGTSQCSIERTNE
jgi:hypothetical protein